MEQIVKAHDTVLHILRKPKTSDSGYRMSQYCLTKEVCDGVLLFHMLTKEMLLLTEEEYENRLSSQYLRARWFVVPEELKEKEYVEMVRLVTKSMNAKSPSITKYTILPTSDCNARCYYCYELGRARVPMSDEVAVRTARYIKDHCGGEKVSINWFGGEPLFNSPAMDLICEELNKAGVVYSSTMLSNGYLFDDEAVKKAAGLWGLKSVQITMDGTEEIYNKSKAYIYKGVNAYKVVLENIARLLKTDIKVIIRLNMNLKNADDLMAFADELAARYPDKTNLRVYAYLLYDDKPVEERYSAEGWTELYDALHRLNSKLLELGLSTKKQRILRKTLRLNSCKADSGKSVIVMPDGKLKLCNQYAEDDYIGDIFSDGFDKEVMESWQERCEELPECQTCFNYPDCIRLKKCKNGNACYDHRRDSIRKSTEQAMVQEYERWKDPSSAKPEDEEDDFMQ